MTDRTRLSVLSLCTLTLIGSIALAATADRSGSFQVRQSPAATLHEQINQTMGLSKSTLLELPVEQMTPAQPFAVTLPILGVERTVTLAPSSVRADGFRVRAQVADGSLVDVDPGIERTMRGMISDMPDALVAGAVHEDGLHLAMFIPNEGRFWIEPVQAHVKDAAANQHVMYNVLDADCKDGTCGVPGEWLDHIIDPGQPIAAAGSTCKIALLACDADFQFYQTFNSSVQQVVDRINLVIDILNVQYENQVGIRHEITEIIVRTSSASNPYTTNNSSALLNQFRNVWATSPENSIPRAIAHLFTGRNLQGSVIGVAWVGVVCSPPGGLGYALSQHLGNLGCMTDLVAHEIGHNWNAPHCSCPQNTMNSSLTCSNSFAQSTINIITNFRNSRTCLADCPAPGPANNECSSAFFVGAGSWNFNNVQATTEGPAESICNFSGDNQVQSDVWYLHIASCDGELTVSACNADFQTKIAVYNGSSCPNTSGTAAACDLSSCALASRASVTMNVSAGQEVLIRVGGHLGAQGSGVLNIDCVPTPANCPADLTGSGDVGLSDLIELVDNWGQCPNPNNCPADLTGSGDVGLGDLIELIGSWGPCP